jgi:hypothetical protein
MANYSITTTVAQERALTWTVARYNAVATNPGAPNVTNAQYLNKAVDHQLDHLVAALRERRRGDLEQAYEDASAATKASVNTTLGYTE